MGEVDSEDLRSAVTKLSPALFQKRVLKWFDRFGRRDFPWQKNKTPYRVWVSEIMLQQTQVSTVIPYFERFMQRFPDLTSLASSQEDAVLHLWTGLGYYSRARNLHRSAQMIEYDLQGHFPDTVEGLQSLPGIGRSTAGAILSCGFNKKATILDGNVKRLLARYSGQTMPLDDRKTLDELWALAEKYTPSQRVSDYTQVMMDLGATLCTPKNPRCEECPLLSSCEAKREGLVEQIPAKKKKTKLPLRQVTFLVLLNQEQILLQKRPAKGIWGGLWSLPEIPGQASLLDLKSHCLEKFKLQIKESKPMKPLRHTFSHFQLDIHPICLKLKRPIPKDLVTEKQIWYSLRQPQMLGLPAPILSLLGDLL